MNSKDSLIDLELDFLRLADDYVDVLTEPAFCVQLIGYITQFAVCGRSKKDAAKALKNLQEAMHAAYLDQMEKKNMCNLCDC